MIKAVEDLKGHRFEVAEDYEYIVEKLGRTPRVMELCYITGFSRAEVYTRLRIVQGKISLKDSLPSKEEQSASILEQLKIRPVKTLKEIAIDLDLGHATVRNRVHESAELYKAYKERPVKKKTNLVAKYGKTVEEYLGREDLQGFNYSEVIKFAGLEHILYSSNIYNWLNRGSIKDPYRSSRPISCKEKVVPVRVEDYLNRKGQGIKRRWCSTRTLTKINMYHVQFNLAEGVSLGTVFKHLREQAERRFVMSGIMPYQEKLEVLWGWISAQFPEVNSEYEVLVKLAYIDASCVRVFGHSITRTPWKAENGTLLIPEGLKPFKFKFSTEAEIDANMDKAGEILTPAELVLASKTARYLSQKSNVEIENEVVVQLPLAEKPRFGFLAEKKEQSNVAI